MLLFPENCFALLFLVPLCMCIRARAFIGVLPDYSTESAAKLL